MPNQANLGPRSYAILLALSAGERHGYELMRQISEDSLGQLVLGPATLYTSLKRLLETRLIEEVETEVVSARRYYRLNTAGKARLNEELERASHFIQLLQQRLS